MERWLWTALVVIVLLAACGGGGGEGDNGSGTSTTTTLPDVGSAGTVGAAGGSVTSDDGKLRLDIPAGALTEETQVEVVEVPAADLGLDATALTGAVYDLLPDGLTFSAPVTVIRSFDAAAAGFGTDEIPWMIMAQGGTEGWEFLSSTTTRRGDTVEVSAEVTHFTGNFVVEAHRIVAFDAETTLTLTPASFNADVGSGAELALSVDIARAIDLSTVGATVSWILTPPLTGNPGDTGGMVKCGDEGEGTYSATLNVDVRENRLKDWAAAIFFSIAGGQITSPTFDLTVVGSATCNPKAGTAATPPDGSSFVEVTQGSATGGNIFNLDGSFIESNTDSLPLFFVRTPITAAPRGLIIVPNPRLFDDGIPAVGIELFQDQRQGCGTTPETTTFITGIVSGLAFNGDSVGCLQLYNPTQPFTIIIYVVTGDTIADYSLVIEPDVFPELGSIDFEDGIGILNPPDGSSFPVPGDLDGNGLPDLFDWVIGADLEPTDPPPYLITDLTGGTDGDALLININLDNPFDPGPDVFSAGLGFQLNAADGTSLVGDALFFDGELVTDAVCLPVPEDCSPIEVAATPNADKTQWTFRFVPPPEVSIDLATARISANAFFVETADSPSLVQQFPDEGSIPFQ